MACWAALLGAALALALEDYDSFQLGTYRDDAIYVLLARSLLHAEAYGVPDVVVPSSSTGFPFGYPLLLAAILLLSSEQVQALKLLSLVATLLNGALLFWAWPWFSRSTSHWWALGVVGLYLLSPLTIGHTRMVMSEPIFTTCCLAAMLLAERAARTRTGPGWVALMGLALTCTLFTRTAGVVIAAGVVVYLLARLRWRSRMVLLPVAGIGALIVGVTVSATPLEWRDLVPEKYSSGWERASATTPPPLRAADGFREYSLSYIRQLIVPFGGGQQEQAFARTIGLPGLSPLLGFTVSALVALGYRVWIGREGLAVFPLCSLLYFMSIVVWPRAGVRFLYPIQPELYFGFLLGGATALGWLTSLVRRSARAQSLGRTASVSLIVALIAAHAVRSHAPGASQENVGDLETRSRWIKLNSQPSDIILTEQPYIDALYSGRRTAPYRGFASAGDLQAYLAEYSVGYILVAPWLRWQEQYAPVLSPASLELLGPIDELVEQGRLELVHASDEAAIKVFKRRL